MSDSDPRLSKSRAALRDLEWALDRIEVALARRDDPARLEEQLREARADYAKLDAAARTVQSGLDGAILRLRAVLEA